MYFYSRRTEIIFRYRYEDSSWCLRVRPDIRLVDLRIREDATRLKVREVLLSSIKTLYITSAISSKYISSENTSIFFDPKAKKDSSSKSDSPTAVDGESSSDIFCGKEKRAGMIGEYSAFAAISSVKDANTDFDYNDHNGPLDSIAIQLKVTPDHLKNAQAHLYLYEGENFGKYYYIALPENSELTGQLVKKSEAKETVTVDSVTDYFTQKAENRKKQRKKREEERQNKQKPQFHLTGLPSNTLVSESPGDHWQTHGRSGLPK